MVTHDYGYAYSGYAYWVGDVKGLASCWAMVTLLLWLWLGLWLWLWLLAMANPNVRPNPNVRVSSREEVRRSLVGTARGGEGLARGRGRVYNNNHLSWGSGTLA